MRIRIKTEMRGLTSRWGRRKEIKQRARKARRVIDKKEARVT